MSRNLIVIVITLFVLSSLFYLFAERNNEAVVKKDVATVNEGTVIRWQKTTITIEEATEKISIRINAPKIIISGNYELGTKVNKAIIELIESLKEDFISGVNTAAYKNGETNTLNIDTEVLLITPRLISLAFTASEHLAGSRDNDPERTFLVFDLVKGKLMIEGNELFRDDIAWSRAVKMMKNHLLADYQGDPSCDLFFAPKYKGFAASCIGIDRSRRGEHLSITGDISMSMIQEFLAPSEEMLETELPTFYYKTRDYKNDPDPWKRGFYDIKIPDHPHEGGRYYLDRAELATVWFKTTHRSGNRYIHAGTFSLGCITLTEIERWDELCQTLMKARKGDGESIGFLEVVL